MSRNSGYGHGSDFGSDLGGSLIALAIIAAIITAYILVRVLSYCIHTFIKFPRQKSLWISLLVALVITLVCGVIATLQANTAWIGGGFAGATLQLFATCIVVQRHHATTCLPESTSIREQILERSWWADTETPFAA